MQRIKKKISLQTDRERTKGEMNQGKGWRKAGFLREVSKGLPEPFNCDCTEKKQGQKPGVKIRRGNRQRSLAYRTISKILSCLGNTGKVRAGM